MSYTLLVVISDSRGELAGLLESLDAHLRPRPPLVVVDNGSSDGGPQLARDRGAEVVELGANRGFGAANNAGLEHVRTPVTVLMNPDVVLLDDGVERLAARAAQRDALVAARLLDPAGGVQKSAHAVPGSLDDALLAVAPLLPRRLRTRTEPWRATAPRDVGWAIGAVLAARTATLRRLGPFDPAAFLHYDDLDLCLRARAAGIPTELRPEVALRHLGGHVINRGGEPFLDHARRRREVVSANLGTRALARDDAAQALTFALRIAAHRDPWRERAQLGALRAARRR